LFFASCASGIRLTPRGCTTTADWSDQINAKDENYFRYERSILMPIGHIVSQEVRLKSFLREDGINCDKLSALKVTIKNRWWDVLFSFVPFVSSKTLLVEGIHSRI